MRRARLLRAVRGRLSDPKAWIKGDMALDSRGHACSGHDSKAVAWCLNGAIQAEAPVVFESVKNPLAYKRFLRTVSSKQLWNLVGAVRNRGYAGTIDFNNAPETSHGDLLRLLDEAIAASEADR